MEINAAAKLELVPKGNQIAVLALFSFSAIFFGTAVWLEYSGKPWVLALTGSVIFLVFGSMGWWVSHKNEALTQSHPFTMKMGDGDNAIAIASDARSLPEVSYIQTVMAHWSALVFRKPLPEADGIVGVGGAPLDGTLQEARILTSRANTEAENQVKDALEMLRMRSGGVVDVAASPIVSVPDPNIG